MWLRAISVLLLIAVICAHEEHEHEHGNEHEHEHEHHDKCSVKELHVVIMKNNAESCSKRFKDKTMDTNTKITICDDVHISCDRGIVTLDRISNQDRQYVVSGCHFANVMFDDNQGCSMCRTQKPKLGQ